MPETTNLITQEDLQHFKDAIRKEATDRAAKWALGSVIALLSVAAIGWWFYLKPKIIYILAGVPTGAVAHFDLRERCPDGWNDFDVANGRFIIGSGRVDNLTARPFSQPGGRETHTLTLNQMPQHTHEYVDFRPAPGGCAFSGCNATGADQTRRTGVAGGLAGGASEPFEIMPPYIALRTCKKD